GGFFVGEIAGRREALLIADLNAAAERVVRVSAVPATEEAEDFVFAVVIAVLVRPESPAELLRNDRKRLAPLLGLDVGIPAEKDDHGEKTDEEEDDDGTVHCGSIGISNPS